VRNRRVPDEPEEGFARFWLIPVNSVYWRKNRDSEAIRADAADSPLTKKGKHAFAQTIAAHVRASNACRSALYEEAQIVGLVG
jgi:hypothetical protein